MGRQKQGGLCWSGRCKDAGTMAFGRDVDGHEVRLCLACYERICAALKAEAHRIAKEEHQNGRH
jgi:hypothetical protein